jgi:DNA-binding transcriptional LysR family regulator
MPGLIARAIVLPRLLEFEKRFPDIELVLGLSDRPADLIYDGIDCVIRTGELTDSTLVARRLGQLELANLRVARLSQGAWRARFGERAGRSSRSQLHIECDRPAA